MNQAASGSPPAPRPVNTLALVSGGALLLGLLAQFGMSGYPQTLVILLGVVVLYYLAGFAAAQRARQPGPEAIGWKILAVSLLTNSLILAARIPAFLGYPLPTLARNASILLQVLVAFLLVGTLLAWHLTPRTRFDRVRHGLDGLLFALSVFFILWGLVLGPAFINDRFPLLDRILWVGTFLVYDLLLGLAIYFGLAEPSRFRGPLGWLSAAFLLASLHNFNWLLGVLSGSPLFHLTIGPLVYTVPLAYLAAALSPRPVDSQPSPPEQVRIIHVLPYLPVIGATTLGVWMLITGGGLNHRLSLVCGSTSR
jgi:hypothetical protein